MKRKKKLESFINEWKEHSIFLNEVNLERHLKIYPNYYYDDEKLYLFNKRKIGYVYNMVPFGYVNIKDDKWCWCWNNEDYKDDYKIYYDKIKEFIMAFPKAFNDKVFSLCDISLENFKNDAIETEIYKYVHAAMYCLNGKSYIDIGNDKTIMLLIAINIKQSGEKITRDMKKAIRK